jgi:hypothetical protein
LLLREFGGLSYGELALALGVSGPAVESLLFRARTRVRGQLKEALASVGWIGDALARLLSAGGAAKIGSVPVVAKVVTAGVGVAVVASTAVVTERHSGSPHRRPAPVHHAAAPVVAAPKPAAPAPQQPAAVVPVAAVRVVRHVRAARPVGQTAPAVAAASQGHQRDDSEAAVKLPVKAEKSHGRPAKRSHGSAHHHGKDGRREAAKIEEASSDHGGGSSRDEGGDAQQPGQSGDSGDSGHGSDSHGNDDSHGSGDAVATGVTRVTDLLPHGGRGLRAGD